MLIFLSWFSALCDGNPSFFFIGSARAISEMRKYGMESHDMQPSLESAPCGETDFIIGSGSVMGEVESWYLM